jgi:alpha-D-ribose 1-methylphosphonate 5-triphosphate synthase subunit PhnH
MSVAVSSSAGILPGFSDPVGAAQATFRAALSALAHPGKIETASPPRAHPQALSEATTALLLSLADSDTPVWMPEGLDDDVKRYLRFHCGCPFVATPAEARFVVVPAGFAWPALADCDPGDAAYPDRSATLLLEVAALAGGPEIVLKGPGINPQRETPQTISIADIPAEFWNEWHANHRQFPLGVDVFFIHGSQFCALPRTTHATGEEKCM